MNKPFIHPNALCESKQIGDGTRIWAFAHVGWVQILRRPAVWAPIFSVFSSLPLTYLLSRWVFRPSNTGVQKGKDNNS